MPWNMPAAGDLTYNFNHPPEFPPLAISQHHTGSVVLMSLIGADGEVKGVKVERSSGFRELDIAAIKAVRGWKFAPAYVSGVPTEGYVRTPVNFNMPRLAPVTN